MDKLKFALGPYEVFSAIIGGSPLILALFLLYNPVGNLQDTFLSVKDELSFPLVLLIGFCSYILGGSIQGITWRYFLLLCKAFRKDYSYFGNMIEERNAALAQTYEPAVIAALDFEDKLVLRLRDKIGIPKNPNWIDSRLAAYLKAISSEAIATSESYLASHIMHRNLSFGFLLLPIVIVTNFFQGGFSFEKLMLIFLSLFIAYMSFFRALAFKRWQNRELLLGFYFSTENRALSNVE